MGGQRTEEPPGKTETAADNSSVGPLPRKSDGARSEHSALARRKYDLLASDATEGGQENVGAASCKAGHGATESQEGTEAEEEGD